MLQTQTSTCHPQRISTDSSFQVVEPDQDVVADTIHIFALNHKECARMLLNTELNFNREYIAKKGYIVYEAIVEGIFTQLLTFPVVLEKSIYYSTLLMDLCRTSLDKIPSIFGRVMRRLYSLLDQDGCMDIQAINRLSELFAHHLSNFGFSWNWDNWEDALDLPISSGKFIFIRETLERCIRLSYYERIKNSVPETFEKHGLIFPSQPPSHHFEYASAVTCSDAVLLQLATDLNREILNRAGEVVIKDFLTKIETHSLAVEPMVEPDILARKVLMQCIMYQGSKSFSHILNVCSIN
jgi:nuclear cap-binding protein subunit 1